MNWTLMGAVFHILTAVSFLSIFLTLSFVASRREVLKHRSSLAVFALFVLFAGVDQVLGLAGAVRVQIGWSVATALLSVTAAVTVIANLPRYLRTLKVAGELRGQAGFLEEQQALLQAIQDSVSDGIMLIGEEGRLIERFKTDVSGYGQLYVFRDITMRRQLEEQRLRLERVITSMKEGFAIVSFDTMRVLSTNPAMEQMLGYEKNELAGRHFSEIQAGSGEERQ